MTDMMGILGIEYLRCLIGVSLIAGLILVIRKVFGKRLPGRLIYGMWLMIPVYMVLVHFVSIPMPQFMNEMMPVGLVKDMNEATGYTKIEQSVNVQISDGNLVEVFEENGNTLVVSQDSKAETIMNRINPVLVVGSIYVAVVCLFVGMILFENVTFVMQCRRKRVYWSASSERKLAVYRLEGISSPFLMGRNIYVPADMENVEELRYAILHEECHYKHGDALWVLLRYMILAIYFYNPIVWLAFKYSGYDCELACDEAVMSKLQEMEIKNYGGCLLNIIEKNKGMQARVLLSTNLKSGKKLIRERIENMVTKRKKSYMAMVLSVFMLFAVTACFLMDAKEVNAESVVPSCEEKAQVAELIPKIQEERVWTEDNEPISEHAPDRNGMDKDVVLNPYIITEFGEGGLFGFGEKEEPVIVSASSTLAPQGKFSYEPSNLAISARDCIWSEGAEKYGIGEWVEVKQVCLEEGEELLQVAEICIVNGYAENETKWNKNSRVKSFKLYYQDEYKGTIYLEDTMYPQYIDVSELQMYVANGAEAVLRFEIAEVYEGSTFADTCMTGIAIDYRGKGKLAYEK